MKYAALLRGINVGGKNMLPMKALAAIFEATGCKNVETYIQSGNVVFEEAIYAHIGNNAFTLKNQQQLPKGMYILRINAAGQPVNYKLVKS